MVKTWGKSKRWIGLGAMGILFIVFAAVEFFNRSNVSREYKLFYGFLIVSGIFILYISINQGIRSIIALINKGYLCIYRFY